MVHQIICAIACITHLLMGDIESRFFVICETNLAGHSNAYCKHSVNMLQKNSQRVIVRICKASLVKSLLVSMLEFARFVCLLVCYYVSILVC